MLYDMLFDWQKEIVDKAAKRNSYGIFLDCGLGKTIVSLSLAELNLCDKIIIISINAKALEDDTVAGSWMSWAKKADIPYTFRNKKCLKTKKLTFTQDPEVLILNYESLFERIKDESKKSKKSKTVKLHANLEQIIASWKGHNIAIICDESHNLKSLQSLQYKATELIVQKCRIISPRCYVYLATGTPFTKDYVDLYAQLKLLGCPMLKQQFLDTFCIFGHNPYLPSYAQPIIGFRNINTLFKLVHTFAVTLKTDEVIALPEQVFIEYNLPETEEFKLFTHKKLKGDRIEAFAAKRGVFLDPIFGVDPKHSSNNPFYSNIMFPSEECMGDTAGAFWMRARQLSIGFNGNAESYEVFNTQRFEAVKKFLIDNPGNYILFYSYTAELLEMYDICQELEYNTDVYCGEAKSMFYYNKYEKMSEEERLTSNNNIILANWQSASTGLNLQLYNKCIILDLPTFGDWTQGLKRISRIGQQSSTIYYIFKQNNFLDDGMYAALRSGQEYDEKLFMNDLGKEDLNAENN